MKTLVLLNGKAGSKADVVGEVRRRLPGAQVQVVRAPGRLREFVQTGLRGGCTTIVAGGGDGTVSSIAAELAGSDVALGVLPLGTWNHFAKDLQIPLDLEAAIEVVRARHTLRVDVGTVNGHIFVNNASLGLYARLANMREKHRRNGWRRATAFLYAALSVLWRYPFLHVRLNVDGEPREAETPLVFIGNNVYETEGLRVGSRSTLQEGQLCLCIAPPTGRLGLLKLPLLALLGQLPRAEGFQMFCTKDATIETRRTMVRVATDGEVTWMHSPLHFSIRHGALKVITPA